MKNVGSKSGGKTKRSVQTTLLNGIKVRLVTVAGKTGTKVTVTEAPIEEWELQAEAVRRLRQLPEYAASASKVRPGSFTLAGDMNAARRSLKEQTKAKATGIAAGDPDLRIYGSGGRLLLIEYKNSEGKLTTSQKERHPLLSALGHPVTVIQASTKEECAARSVEAVRTWLAAA